MSQPLRAPAPVVQLVPELMEYAAERTASGRSCFATRLGAWSGYTFMAAARAMRAFAALLERDERSPRRASRSGLEQPAGVGARLSVRARGGRRRRAAGRAAQGAGGGASCSPLAERPHAIGDARHLAVLDAARPHRRPSCDCCRSMPARAFPHWDQCAARVRVHARTAVRAGVRHPRNDRRPSPCCCSHRARPARRRA